MSKENGRMLLKETVIEGVFCMDGMEIAKIEDDFLEDSFDCFHPETGELMLGDIVISLERAQEQCEEYGHSLEREVMYLLVHGLLHLAGYDHMEEEDKKVMRAQEEKLLAQIGAIR